MNSKRFVRCEGFWLWLGAVLLYGAMPLALALDVVAADPAGAAEKQVQLDELVQEAMANNKEIQSLEDRARALRAEAPFAGSLKDPMLGFALLNMPVDTFDFDQEPMTQKQLTISQQVPWFGKLSLAEQGAELMAVEQEAMVRAMRLSVTKQLKDAWYELAFVERSLEINERLREIVGQMLEVAESRYATGEGLQQDILMAQVQLSELIDREVTLKASRTRLQDSIGALLNREGYFTASGERLTLPDLSPLDRKQLTEQALGNNPLLEARRTSVLKAEVDVQLAEKDYLPDMNFTLAYGQREDGPGGQDRPDFLSAGVSLTVPLWQNTRQDSKLAGAKKRLLASRHSLLALEKTLPHRIDALLAEIDGARESKELFTDAISVQASQLADSSLAAYSVGEVEFGTMLSARMRLLQVELKEEQYTTQVYRKLAELEETIGRDIAGYIKEK